MKCYSQAPDVDSCIEKIKAEFHVELKIVTVVALFVFDDESSEPVLKHQGYPAGAVVSITPLKERCLGIADALIVVDRAGWVAMSQRQREALVDHELTHLTVATDKETGAPLCDARGRPKVVMRMHDHQFGWFDEIAEQHGENSPEVRQARSFVDSCRQLYLEFAPPTAVSRVSYIGDRAKTGVDA